MPVHVENARTARAPRGAPRGHLSLSALDQQDITTPAVMTMGLLGHLNQEVCLTCVIPNITPTVVFIVWYFEHDEPRRSAGSYQNCHSA